MGLSLMYIHTVFSLFVALYLRFLLSTNEIVKLYCVCIRPRCLKIPILLYILRYVRDVDEIYPTGSCHYKSLLLSFLYLYLYIYAYTIYPFVSHIYIYICICILFTFQLPIMRAECSVSNWKI